jgi:DNA-binding CsgD family transcriptional regulator
LKQTAIVLEPSRVSELAPLVLGAYTLTRRERELVAHIFRGATTAVIARELGISANTVQDHLKSVFAKTGLHSRRELVAHLTPSGYPDASGLE